MYFIEFVGTVRKKKKRLSMMAGVSAKVGAFRDGDLVAVNNVSI